MRESIAALEAQLRMKQDDELRLCKEIDALRAQLAAAERVVEAANAFLHAWPEMLDISPRAAELRAALADWQRAKGEGA